MRRLSNLDDDELMRYVAKIRRIAKMDDSDAMIEVDELIQDLALCGLGDLDSDFESDSDFDFAIDIPKSGRNIGLEEAKEYLSKLSINLEELRKNVKGEYLPFTREAIEKLGHDWPNPVKEALQDNIRQVKRTANELADLNDYLDCSSVIRAQGRRTIYNQQTVRSILEKLAFTEARLQETHTLTDDLRQELRRGRERCARFRAEKKLEKVRLAEDSGKRTKAFNLKREAQALLKQDWEKAFPGEQCPKI